MLSTLLERWKDAEVHFARALSLEECVQGHVLLPRTRYWQARFLRQRGYPADGATARVLLMSVVEETSRLGMQKLCREANYLAGG
jgi:hypothetical protein